MGFRRMKIKAKVIPNAKKNEVIESGGIKVYVKSPAKEGKANKEAVELLAKYFKVKKNQIKIVRGKKSREKVIELAR